MSGWIKLHRKIKNHWLFDKPETFRSWIIILLEVNYNPRKVLIKGKILECSQGQSLNSYETWGRLFGGWSKSRVRRFFQLLESDSMIELISEGVTTRLSVCNYETYQEQTIANDTLPKSVDGTDAERIRDTNKKGKKDKESKEVKSVVKKFTPPTLQQVSEFISEKGMTISAERFFSHYESVGWMVGKSKMKDWKAAARGWQSREKQSAHQQQSNLSPAEIAIAELNRQQQEARS